MNPLQTLNHFLAELGDLAPATLATLILIGFNLLLRITPGIKNVLIPWLSIALGMAIFPFYLPRATQFDNPIGRNIGLGFLVGLFAAVGYGSIVRFAAKKWPWLDVVLNYEPKKDQNENNSKSVGGNSVSGNDRLSGGDDDRV